MVRIIVKTALAGLVVSSLWGCNDAQQYLLCSGKASERSHLIADFAKVNIDYSEKGSVTARFFIPDKFSVDASLIEAKSLLSLMTTKTCTAAVPNVIERQGAVEIHLAYECDEGNVLKKADVLLFENYPDLLEMEVHIFTPAVDKHFVLNRQCKQPIYTYKTD